jgi:hypothetical protein
LRAFARAGSDFQTATDYQPGFNQTFQAASYLIALYHTTNPQHLSPRYKPNGRPQHRCHKSRAAISESFAVPRSGSVPLTSVFAFIFLFFHSVSLFPFPFLFPFFLSFPVYLILSGRQSPATKDGRLCQFFLSECSVFANLFITFLCLGGCLINFVIYCVLSVTCSFRRLGA